MVAYFLGGLFQKLQGGSAESVRFNFAFVRLLGTRKRWRGYRVFHNNSNNNNK